MKPVKAKTRLQLNKETLRTLTSDQLAGVGGASLLDNCPLPPESGAICPPDPPGDFSNNRDIRCNGTIQIPRLSPVLGPGRDGFGSLKLGAMCQ